MKNLGGVYQEKSQKSCTFLKSFKNNALCVYLVGMITGCEYVQLFHVRFFKSCTFDRAGDAVKKR